MDKSLARGYARMYLRDLPDRTSLAHDILVKRERAIFNTMEQVATKKRPDRALRKLAALLPVECERLDVLAAKRSSCLISSSVISRASQNSLLTAGAGAPAFEETAVEMARILLTANREGLESHFVATARVSQHALERLLQRNAIEGEKLGADLRKVLFLVDHVLWRLLDSMDMSKVKDTALLVPFRGGALVTSFVAQSLETDSPEESGWCMSVRTFLEPDMIGEEEQERMHTMMQELQGLKMSQLRGPGFSDPDRDAEEIKEAWCQIAAENAVPWRAYSRRAPHDLGQRNPRDVACAA